MTWLAITLIGRRPQIFLVGLILQLISFAIFTVVFLRFLQLVYQLENHIWVKGSRETWRLDWRALAAAMTFNSVGILVRPRASWPPLPVLTSLCRSVRSIV